jgi:hypothetical protein
LPVASYLLALCLFSLSACFEPRENCLDIEATNFDAAADKNCCCTYPALKLTLLPRFDTLVWKPDTAYQYAPGQWFRLKQAVFYLSDFQLVQSGTAIRVSDTLSLQTWGSSNDTALIKFTNDFQLIRRTAVNYTVGTFRPSGMFESVRFQLGLPDSAQQVIPSLAPQGHPLRPQSEGLWLGRDTGFVALKLVLTRDTFSSTIPDTLLFHRPDFGAVFVQEDGLFIHESGFDFKLNLTTDYREMFRDVDLSSGDISAWKAQIVANLPKVFRVTQ